MKLGPRAIERRSPPNIGGWIPAARFTTVVLLLINFGLYIATAIYSMQIDDGGGLFDIDWRALVLFGGQMPSAIAQGQWWRLITAGFLHGGILHIGMNSWIIFDLGTTVEEVYGTARYLAIYFVATITGFYASYLMGNALSVGASAGLFGLIGAMIAVGMTTKSSMGAAMRGHYIQWAIYGLIIGLLPGLHIDNAAHVGGLAGGFAIAYIAGAPRLYDNWTEKLWRIAAGCCIILTAVAFWMMFLFATSTQITDAVPQRDLMRPAQVQASATDKAAG